MDNQIVAKRYRTELSSVKDLIFKFLLVWTAILLVLSWVDFLTKYKVSEGMVTSYLILLGVYIVHKETSRWTGVKVGIRRPGELFVYIWWVSLLTMLLIGFFLHRETSSSVRFLTYEVLGAFLLSEISKGVNAYKIAGGNLE